MSGSVISPPQGDLFTRYIGKLAKYNINPFDIHIDFYFRVDAFVCSLCTRNNAVFPGRGPKCTDSWLHTGSGHELDASVFVWIPAAVGRLGTRVDAVRVTRALATQRISGA